MKNKMVYLILLSMIAVGLLSCNSNSGSNESGTASVQEAVASAEDGQSTVVDDVSEKNIVNVAVGSPDHTTLVAAVKAAKLVDALSNAGPFTVFAPTNAAFDALPSGTVDGLLKPEKIADLQDILQYHVSIGVFKTEGMTDGQILGQANDGKVTIGVTDDGTYTANGATIIASIPASNGLIHVVDRVLLPPPAK